MSQPSPKTEKKEVNEKTPKLARKILIMTIIASALDSAGDAPPHPGMLELTCCGACPSRIVGVGTRRPRDPRATESIPENEGRRLLVAITLLASKIFHNLAEESAR